MNRLLKIGALLLSAGLIILVIVYVLYGRTLDKANIGLPFDKKTETFEASEIKELLIDIEVDDVKILGTDDNEFKVTYKENNEHRFNVETANSTLSIKTDRNNHKDKSKYRIFNFISNFSFFDSEEPYVQVKVPARVLKKLEAKSEAGDLELENIAVAEAVMIKVNAGDLEIDNMEAGSLEVSSDAGDINLENIKLAGDLNIYSSTGDVDVEKLKVQTALINNETGDTNFEEIEPEKELKVINSSGEIEGSLVGKKSDYTIQADVELGDCNISNQSGGDKLLILEVDNGDAYITFSN